MNPKRIIYKLLSAIKYLPFVNFIRMHGSEIKATDKVLLNCKIMCKGKNNLIICKSGGVLRNCSIHINGDNNVIEIGNKTTIINGDFCIEDNNNLIQIGDNTKMCGKIHLAATEGSRIIIGNDCLFSSEIVFRTGDSHSLLDMSGNRINPAADIIIDNHVWVGHRVMINKGVRISADSMIGTGAVVTKSVDEKNVVIAGVPAKVVKREINWCIERI